MLEKTDISYIGQTNFRNERKAFGIKEGDRLSHLYLVGKTGTGKSTTLMHLAMQDIYGDRGCALFDGHGDLAERIASRIPEKRKEDLIYLNVADTELGFNPLLSIPPNRRPLVASEILEAFKKIWIDSWGPRLEHFLRQGLLCLLDQPSATLADMLRLFDEPTYRKRAAGRVSNPHVRQFWLSEYETYPARLRADATSPVRNKVGAFLAHPRIARIVTAEKNSLDLRRIMDERKILVVNLAKGKIGEDAALLFGALLFSLMGDAALSRADIPENQRRDFHIYLDEFQSITSLSLAGMLSELRKYRVSLTLSHQHISQLHPFVRDAILGNVGTIASFRVGAVDAELLAKEFYPVFHADDFIRLPNYQMYLKLMIDGVASRPFSAETLPPGYF